MKRHVLIYGLIGGLLIAALNLIEYRYLVIEHSVEIYGGLIAAVFSAVGIWLGLRITARRRPVEADASSEAVAGLSAVSAQPFRPDEKRREDLKITPRELEILNLIAQGMSNREIAERLFVSENTVKTHSSRVFDKLGAKRRTQAVQLGKEFGLLP
jgi:DNA-binding CsgD family transcriptional regulator